VRKGPWLMAPRAGGITVMVEREQPGPVSVRAWELVPAGEREPGPLIVNDPAVTLLHELRIAGLRPGGRYRYEVTGPGLEVTRGAFNAMPAAFEPFRFVLYGDTRGDHRAHAAVMRAVARRARTSSSTRATSWATGAARTSGSSSSPSSARRCATPRGCPSWATTSSRARAAWASPDFRRYVHSEEDSPRPELDYTLRYGNVRLVLANAFDNWTSPHMRAWLDGQLGRMRAEGPEDFVLVVLHWGMHSSGNHGENGALRRAGIADLFRRHRVDLVVAGHDHVYERGEERGLRYMVTGGGGAGLYVQRTRHPYTQVFARQHHYVRVDVARDALSLVALRPDGTVLDRFTIRHPNARAAPPPAVSPPPPAPMPAAPARPAPGAPPPSTSSCRCDARGLREAPCARALGLCVGLAAARSRRRRAARAAALTPR
jgi:hypothetical protein